MFGSGIAEPTRRNAGDEVIHRLIGQKRNLGVQERHIDVGTLRSLMSAIERGKDADCGVDACQDVCDCNADLLRLAVRSARNIHNPAHALDYEIVSCAGRVRAGLAKSGDRTINEAWVAGLRDAWSRLNFSSPPTLKFSIKTSACAASSRRFRDLSRHRNPARSIACRDLRRESRRRISRPPARRRMGDPRCAYHHRLQTAPPLLRSRRGRRGFALSTAQQGYERAQGREFRLAAASDLPLIFSLSSAAHPDAAQANA